uniref:arf-GAP with coiled-coil, ANK repeat and PH domain-containing protein 3 n=1 Tax=Panthera onca TaxID=9690 RepID=UPI002953FB0D|nr:arf-GAP with coiled-coil, ANK repeat and PH domain-containing protein 3 [Panthera onca]
MTVEFEECIKDSPRFRATIDEVETDVVEIEAKLDKLVKLCSGMIEAGKAYVTTNRLFVSGVRDLSQQCQGDTVISECLQRFGDSLQEMVNYHMILFDQAQRSVRQQLHNFVKEDVRKFKETKKQFDKVREDMELSLVRNAQAPRHRPHEVEEATGALTLTRKCFRHLALDYVLQINVLQAKKKFEILDSMLSFMHAQHSFFQQGYSLLHQLDPYMKKLAAELDQLVIDSAVEKREMERKHAAIQQRTLLQDFSYDEPKVEFDVDAPSGVVMEGYLFKRASNAFKTWNRRWFSIQNSQLVYQKKLKDVLTVVVDDLRLCSVKPCEDIERRFCFEVVSPTKSCMLQADSEKLRQAWVQAVQASIASAYRESPDSCYSERLDRTASPSTSSIDSATDSRERSVKGESVLQRVQNVAGNSQCGDCGQPDPRWASINLGVLLCIECSGIHRSLGVHCSKVRSLTLDSWEPELLKLMCELGNSTVNQIYEAQCEGPGGRKPTASSPRQDKEAWIKDKYVEKKFLRKPPSAPARDVPRPWRAQKCQRHHSSPRVPAARRKVRLEPVLPSVAALSSAGAVERKFRRDSLFCPDELDSLFSYFDAGAAAAGPRSLSSDSGLGGSSDGSSDVLAFGAGSVVDSVTEEGIPPQFCGQTTHLVGTRYSTCRLWGSASWQLGTSPDPSCSMQTDPGAKVRPHSPLAPARPIRSTPTPAPRHGTPLAPISPGKRGTLDAFLPCSAHSRHLEEGKEAELPRPVCGKFLLGKAAREAATAHSGRGGGRGSSPSGQGATQGQPSPRLPKTSPGVTAPLFLCSGPAPTLFGSGSLWQGWTHWLGELSAEEPRTTAQGS